MARMDLPQFCGWLNLVPPGTPMEYHRGFLARDRTVGLSRLGDESRRTLDRMAATAYALAQRGHLRLVQRRLADGQFSYLAIKAGAPRTIGGARVSGRIEVGP